MRQIGVAFVRGLNMYGQNRITIDEMRQLLTQIEDDTLHIIDLYKADNIIFEKNGIHYAQAGLRIQKVLQDHLGKQVSVTARSLTTVKRLMEKLQQLE